MSGGRARARLLAALALGALLIAVIEASELGEIARTTVRGPYSDADPRPTAIAARGAASSSTSSAASSSISSAAPTAVARAD